MKKIYTLITLLILLSAETYSQTVINCGSNRYDQEVFSAVTVTSNIQYGSNVDYFGATINLTMDIYQPSGDTAAMRPVIFWTHGGSFIGGSKTDVDVVSLCNHFAKRGYVCVSIEYRLGMSFPPTQTSATQAVYRAVQDMKAAIRYMRKDAATANLYHIDPNLIFGGGSSAGAFTALHLAYLNQPSELPSQIDTVALGGIEGNSGNPGYISTVNAVLNLCGALGNKTWVVPGDIPLCSMHGTADNVVPYATAMLFVSIFQIMVVDGSYSINAYADSIGVPNVMYTYYGAGHVPFSGTNATALAYMDTTVRFVSNFLYTYLSCTPSDPNPLPNTFNILSVPQPIADANEISIYPNPANDYVMIETKNSSLQKVELSDIAGRLLIHHEKISSPKITIERGNLSAGIYFLKITSDGKTVTKKICFE